MAKIHVGDKGLKIILNVSTDITAATSQKILYKKPNGDTGNWTAVKESNNTSISYTTPATTTIDVAGTWEFQSYVVTPSWELYGDMVEQVVDERIAPIA